MQASSLDVLKGFYESGVVRALGRDQGFAACCCGCPIHLEINAVDISVSWTSSSFLPVFTFLSGEGNPGPTTPALFLYRSHGPGAFRP